MRTNQANAPENVNKWVFTIIIFAMIKGLFVYHYSGKFKLLKCEPTIILYANKAPLTLEANFNLHRGCNCKVSNQDLLLRYHDKVFLFEHFPKA